LIRYLIDTNVVSESGKPKPYGAVVAWLQSLELGQGFFSGVMFREIQKGVELTCRQDPIKANDIEGWAAQLERTSQVLPMDAACFREYARLMHRRSDTLGGCHDCRHGSHRLTVATRNERDFAHFEVAVLNPFGHRAP
jgi:predicted nucleic acid-binding protein